VLNGCAKCKSCAARGCSRSHSIGNKVIGSRRDKRNCGNLRVRARARERGTGEGRGREEGGGGG
jgi:hypothetical protein